MMMIFFIYLKFFGETASCPVPQKCPPYMPWPPWVMRQKMDHLYMCHITQAIQGKLGTYFCGVKHSSLFANDDEIFL